MQRTIVQPAVLDGAALSELKHWLGISRPGEDGLLADLLEASLAMCEAFTGQYALAQTIEEIVPAARGWQQLTAQPVRSLVAAAWVNADASRSAIADPASTFELRLGLTACVQLLVPASQPLLALQLRVGLADGWNDLAAPLKQGIIRLAAHHYRDRDGSRILPPPASVTALWRPWRCVRLG